MQRYLVCKTWRRVNKKDDQRRGFPSKWEALFCVFFVFFIFVFFFFCLPYDTMVIIVSRYTENIFLQKGTYEETMRFWNNGGFFSSVKGHVIKWWQFVLMPVLRINNNKSQTIQPMQQPEKTVVQPETVQQPIQESIKQPIQQSVENTMPPVQRSVENTTPTVQQPIPVDEKQNVIVTEDPMEVLRRINEEKEEARRKEIEEAKKKASEEARIAAIMNANKVDVNAFIEAGKAAKEEIATKKAEEKLRREAAEQKAREVQPATAVKAAVDAELEKQRKRDEDLRRAQEIMDRLNREAAEDEAKKQAEIEAAKQEAKKQFG